MFCTGCGCIMCRGRPCLCGNGQDITMALAGFAEAVHSSGVGGKGFAEAVGWTACEVCSAERLSEAAEAERLAEAELVNCAEAERLAEAELAEAESQMNEAIETPELLELINRSPCRT